MLALRSLASNHSSHPLLVRFREQPKRPAMEEWDARRRSSSYLSRSTDAILQDSVTNDTVTQ